MVVPNGLNQLFLCLSVVPPKHENFGSRIFGDCAQNGVGEYGAGGKFVEADYNCLLYCEMVHSGKAKHPWLPDWKSRQLPDQPKLKWSANFAQPSSQGEEIPGPEILKIATSLKDLGSKAFKGGDVRLALAKYQKGIRYLNEYPEANDNDPPTLGADLKALKVTLYNNSALMQNKLQDYEGAIKSCTNAIEAPGISDDAKAKAYYRRGTAYAARKNEDGAIADLEAAQKLAPNDAAISKDLAAFKKKALERVKKEKAAYAKYFS